MAQFGTAQVAATAGDTPAGRNAVRGLPEAPFMTQLIAEYQHLPPQRARRRAPLSEVLRVYDAGDHIDDRRLPAGYRKSITA